MNVMTKQGIVKSEKVIFSFFHISGISHQFVKQVHHSKKK